MKRSPKYTRFHLKFFESWLVARTMSPSYKMLLSKNFLVGFLLNFFCRQNWLVDDYNIVDAFASFYEDGSNLAYFGIVEKYGKDHFLHMTCLVNFERKRLRNMDSLSISQSSIDKFVTNVKQHYSKIRVTSKNVLLLNMMSSLWIQRSQVVQPAETPASTNDFPGVNFFVRLINREDKKLDFDKFKSIFLKNLFVDGSEFGKDFFDMVALQWNEDVRRFRLNTDKDGFYEYIGGRLNNWVGNTINDIIVDVESTGTCVKGTCHIRQIYYEVKNAIKGKIWRATKLRTNIRIQQSHESSVPNFFKPSYAEEYPSRIEADNLQIITITVDSHGKTDDLPKIDFFTFVPYHGLDRPLPERIFTSVRRIDFVIGREVRKFLEKSHRFNYLAAHLFGQLMIDTEGVTRSFELRPRICRQLGIGDYLFVLQHLNDQILIISIAEGSVNYDHLFKYVKKLFNTPHLEFYLCAIGKWQHGTPRSPPYLRHLINFSTQNILFVARRENEIRGYLQHYPPQTKAVRFDEDFDITLFRAIPTLNFNHDFLSNAYIRFTDIDMIIYNIVQLSASALELKDGFMLSLVVNNLLGNAFKIERSEFDENALLFYFENHDDSSDGNFHHSGKVFKRFAYGTDYRKLKKIDKSRALQEKADFHLYTYFMHDKICNTFIV